MPPLPLMSKMTEDSQYFSREEDRSAFLFIFIGFMISHIAKFYLGDPLMPLANIAASIFKCVIIFILY